MERDRKSNVTRENEEELAEGWREGSGGNSWSLTSTAITGDEAKVEGRVERVRETHARIGNEGRGSPKKARVAGGERGFWAPSSVVEQFKHCKKHLFTSNINDPLIK